MGDTLFRQALQGHPCRIQLGSAQAVTWSVNWEPNGRLLFSCDQDPKTKQSVCLEEEFQLGPFRARVLDTRVQLPFALILSNSAGDQHRWEFSSGIYLLGRPGKRKNHLSLSHQSISREHAKLEIQGAVAFLVCDSNSGLSAVDGVALDKGERIALSPGSRIQLGDYVGHWIRIEETKPTHGPQFSLNLFGGFRLQRHDRIAKEPVKIRTEKARQLLAWLALQRSRSLSTQKVFEDFWPDRELLRQRKNLSHTLKTLQSELGLEDHVFAQMIGRTAEVLSLDPEFFLSVDTWELADAKAESETLPPILELHESILLPEMRSDWARTARHDFFLTWLRLLLKIEPSESLRRDILQQVTALLREGDFEEFVYPVAFDLAKRLRAPESLQQWYLEYSQDLQRQFSDQPSESLTQHFERTLKAIGTVSEQPRA